MSCRNVLSLTNATLIGVSVLMSACAPVAPLANGDATRTWMREQTFDPGASARHGDQAPQGTDPEVTNNAVEQLRKPSKTPRSAAGSLPDVLKELVE